eukprot:gene10429-8379_t
MGPKPLSLAYAGRRLIGEPEGYGRKKELQVKKWLTQVPGNSAPLGPQESDGQLVPDQQWDPYTEVLFKRPDQQWAPSMEVLFEWVREAAQTGRLQLPAINTLQTRTPQKLTKDTMRTSIHPCSPTSSGTRPWRSYLRPDQQLAPSMEVLFKWPDQQWAPSMEVLFKWPDQQWDPSMEVLFEDTRDSTDWAPATPGKKKPSQGGAAEIPPQTPSRPATADVTASQDVVGGKPTSPKPAAAPVPPSSPGRTPEEQPPQAPPANKPFSFQWSHIRAHHPLSGVAGGGPPHAAGPPANPPDSTSEHSLGVLLNSGGLPNPHSSMNSVPSTPVLPLDFVLDSPLGLGPLGKTSANGGESLRRSVAAAAGVLLARVDASATPGASEADKYKQALVLALTERQQLGEAVRAELAAARALAAESEECARQATAVAKDEIEALTQRLAEAEKDAATARGEALKVQQEARAKLMAVEDNEEEYARQAEAAGNLEEARKANTALKEQLGLAANRSAAVRRPMPAKDSPISHLLAGQQAAALPSKSRPKFAAAAAAAALQKTSSTVAASPAKSP